MKSKIVISKHEVFRREWRQGSRWGVRQGFFLFEKMRPLTTNIYSLFFEAVLQKPWMFTLKRRVQKPKESSSRVCPFEGMVSNETMTYDTTSYPSKNVSLKKVRSLLSIKGLLRWTETRTSDLVHRYTIFHPSDKTIRGCFFRKFLSTWDLTSKGVSDWDTRTSRMSWRD